MGKKVANQLKDKLDDGRVVVVRTEKEIVEIYAVSPGRGYALKITQNCFQDYTMDVVKPSKLVELLTTSELVGIR